MSGRTVLIGGDAPLRTWSGLPPVDLPADVFRIPHHGGALDDGGVPSGWSAEQLYDGVKPHTAIISVGTRNRHDHPNPDWSSPLMRGSCRLVCTQATERCQPGLKTDAEILRKDVVALYADHLSGQAPTRGSKARRA